MSVVVLLSWPRNPESHQTLARALLLLGLGLLLWFSAAMLLESWYKPLLYDDAYNASIAKNWINGLGWASSYQYLWPFDPRVTSGPTLLLPAAFAIGAIGTPFWLPALVTTVCMLLALYLALWCCRHAFEERLAYASFLLPLVILLSVYDRNTWQTLIGDGIIALLLAIMAGIAARNVLSRGALLSLGLLAALCFLSKLYSLIALFGFACYMLLQWLDARQQTDHSARQILRYGWMLAPIALLVLPWRLYKAHSIDGMSQALRENHDFVSESFFRFHGSGIGQWQNADSTLGFVTTNLQRNINGLSQALNQYGPGLILSLLMIIALIAATLHMALIRRRPLDNYILCSGLCACAHFSWYLMINPSQWIHYSRVCMLLGLFTLCAYMVRLRLALPFSIAVVVLALAQPDPAASSWRQYFSLSQSEHLFTQDHKRIARHLSATDYADPVAGCGWAVPRHIEYALPGAFHFKDCYLLLQNRVTQQLRQQHSLPAAQLDGADRDLLHDRDLLLQHIPTSDLVLDTPLRFNLIYLDWLYSWIPNRQLAELREQCSKRVFETASSAVEFCEVTRLSPRLTRAMVNYRPNLR